MKRKAYLNTYFKRLLYRTMSYNSFNDGGPYHIEINPLICRADQWTGFYNDKYLRYERVKQIHHSHKPLEYLAERRI